MHPLQPDSTNEKQSKKIARKLTHGHARPAKTGMLNARIREVIASQGIEAELQLAEFTETGIPVDLFKNDKQLLGLMVEHNVLPRNTLASARKSKSGKLSPANTERVIRVLRIRQAVADAFGEEHVDDWLETPVETLGGEVPMRLLANEAGARAVEIYLNRVKYGMNA